MRVLVLAATVMEVEWVRGHETLATGVGPVEAAVRTAQRLAHDAPDAVLHVGIAGARQASGLQIGEIIIGTESHYSDLSAQIPSLVTTALPDPELFARIAALLPTAKQLPIATSAAIGGRHNCNVEAMEGFAVLRAAAHAGVPCVEVRAISNMVEESDRSKWDFAGGLQAIAIAARTVLDGLERDGADSIRR